VLVNVVDRQQQGPQQRGLEGGAPVRRRCGHCAAAGQDAEPGWGPGRGAQTGYALRFEGRTRHGMWGVDRRCTPVCVCARTTLLSGADAAW
jgi:hypothetical protein